eukprot:357554-Chlamydomonas_euryale.AAC.2
MVSHVPLAPQGMPRGGGLPNGLSREDLQHIHEQWAKFWGPVSPADRNRILAQRMKELTEGDPWALDMAKQDGKDYV